MKSKSRKEVPTIIAHTLTPYAKLIRKRLIDKDLSQKELTALICKKTGCRVAYKTVNMIALGRRPGRVYAPAINEILGISTEEYYAATQKP